ncbi:hypothetical protein [Tychonema sp. BBK16]|uniref:hypothetical protein n=1 Tax=Tychonema sp. BBK16 TaxID=2699888 RepID=UPI001F1F3DB8|nr:hypothetical protein [Tychonema sp. BBK16]MCF6374171.1 hypothetical protein [Tychonema sp. BBK16]
MITENPLFLLDTLSKHPHGLELASLVYKLHQDGQRQTQPKPPLVAIALNLPKRQLVAIALNLAERQAIKEKDIPYFNDMANDKIREWIAQHSPKQEVN